MEELDERCERAYAAQTHGQLRALLVDLPAGRAPTVRPPLRSIQSGIGRQPFAFVFALPTAPDAAMEAALRTMAPALAHDSYGSSGATSGGSSSTTATAPAGSRSVILFPGPGLLALLIKEHDRVAVEFEPAAGDGARLVVHGRAPRQVRRAFAQLQRP